MLKYTDQSYTLNGSFIHAWFYNTDYLTNTVSLSYAYLPNGDTFNHTMFSKITLVNITADLIRKGYKYQKLTHKLMVTDTGFQNSNFHFKSQISSLKTNTVSYFP